MSPIVPLSVKNLVKDERVQILGLCAGICAATAVAVGNPIGAFGGAVYGAHHGIMSQNVNKYLQENQIRSVAIDIFSFIATTAAAWKFASLCGFVMSFKAALILGGSPIAVYYALELVRGLLTEGFRDARYGRV